MKLPWSSP